MEILNNDIIFSLKLTDKQFTFFVGLESVCICFGCNNKNAPKIKKYAFLN